MKAWILLVAFLLVPCVSAVSVLVPEWAANTTVVNESVRQLSFTLRGDSSPTNGTFSVSSMGPLTFNGSANFSQSVALGVHEAKVLVIGMRAAGNSSAPVKVTYGFSSGSGMFQQVLNSNFLVSIVNSSVNMSVVVNVSSNSTPSSSSNPKSSSSKGSIDWGKSVVNKTNVSAPVVSPPIQAQPVSPKVVQDIAGQESGIANMLVDSGPPDGTPIHEPSGSKAEEASSKAIAFRAGEAFVLILLGMLLMSVVLSAITFVLIKREEG